MEGQKKGDKAKKGKHGERARGEKGGSRTHIHRRRPQTGRKKNEEGSEGAVLFEPLKKVLGPLFLVGLLLLARGRCAPVPSFHSSEEEGGEMAQNPE
jgi:hypothetical protein